MSNQPPSQRAAGAPSAPPIPPQESMPPVAPTPPPEMAGASATPAVPPQEAMPAANETEPVSTDTMVAQITNPDMQKVDMSVPPSKRAHDVAANDALLKLYLQKRVDGQLVFYKNRTREFDNNTSFTVRLGALIMAISFFLAAIGVGGNSPLLAMISALLPALAALVASFRQLYQWDKQAALYRDASLGLQESMLIVPDGDLYDKRTAPLVLNSLVMASEDVFKAEINQWGQIALGLGGKEDQDKLNQALRSLEIYDQQVGGAAAAESTPRGEAPPPPVEVDFNDGGSG